MKKLTTLFILLPSIVFADPIVGTVNLNNGVAIVNNTNISAQDIAIPSIKIPKGSLGLHYVANCANGKLTITSINMNGGTAMLDNSKIGYAIFEKGE